MVHHHHHHRPCFSSAINTGHCICICSDDDAEIGWSEVKRAAVDGMEELSCSVARQPPPSEHLWQQHFSALITFFWTKITSWDFPPASLLPFLEPQVNINNLEQWLPTCRKEQAYVCELVLSFKSVSNLSLRNCEMMSLLLVKKVKAQVIEISQLRERSKKQQNQNKWRIFFSEEGQWLNLYDLLTQSLRLNQWITGSKWINQNNSNQNENHLDQHQ